MMTGPVEQCSSRPACLPASHLPPPPPPPLPIHLPESTGGYTPCRTISLRARQRSSLRQLGLVLSRRMISHRPLSFDPVVDGSKTAARTPPLASSANSVRPADPRRSGREHRLVYVDGSFLAAQQNTTPPARRTADRPVCQARSIAIASRELLPRVARGEAQRRFGRLRHSSAPPVAFTPGRLVPERRRGPEPYAFRPAIEPPGWKFPVEHSYASATTCLERIDRRPNPR